MSGDKCIRIEKAEMPMHYHPLRFSPSLDEKLYEEMQKYMQEAISGSFGVPLHMIDVVPELMHRRDMERVQYDIEVWRKSNHPIESLVFKGFILSPYDNELLLLL